MAALGNTSDTVISASSTVIVPANKGRRRLVVTNDGGAKIYLAYTPEGKTIVPAVIGKGVPLSPTGSVQEDRAGPKHRAFAGAISAITAGADVEVAILELDER